MADFQKGEYNVLVATSIGEEGLDIGDVDLIVCYDSHSSPIRMVSKSNGFFVTLTPHERAAGFVN